MSHSATIRDLILAAAEGAGAGITELKSKDIPVELDEFEIEVTYAAETEVASSTGGSAEIKFRIFKAKFGHRQSSRDRQAYGLKVRFLFSGATPDAE